MVQSITGGDYSIVASFTTPENEKLYGMGEYQQNILNLKGCTLELAHRNSAGIYSFRGFQRRIWLSVE